MPLQQSGGNLRAFTLRLQYCHNLLLVVLCGALAGCPAETPSADEFASATDASTVDQPSGVADAPASDDTDHVVSDGAISPDQDTLTDGAIGTDAAADSDAGAPLDAGGVDDAGNTADAGLAQDAGGDTSGPECKSATDCTEKIPADQLAPCEMVACLAGLCGKTEKSSGACDDGDACTTASTCVVGTCAGGQPVTCDDQNPCTQDTCTSPTGCSATHVSNGAPCSTAATCVSGKCTPTATAGYQIAGGGLAVIPPIVSASGYAIRRAGLLPTASLCAGNFCVTGGLRP